MKKMTPCLWFDGNAEEAVKFYVSIFKKSKIISTSYYTKSGPLPEGTVLTITFRIEGQEFVALNAGPEYRFTPAISLMLPCKTQKEIDSLWEKLTDGGQEVQCGWLTDKFGLSWQVFPEISMKMILDKDAERRDRVMQAIQRAVKPDLEDLKRAYAKKGAHA